MRSGVGRRQKGKRRVIVQMHVTLDGVIAPPPEASLPYMSDEGRQATLDLALASDALLLGRVTWQQLAPAWREQTGAMAERFNAMPKYVVTSTLGSADEWSNSELIAYGESRACASGSTCSPTGLGRSPVTCCAAGSSMSFTST